MRIALDQKTAFLKSVNARAEKHGDETEPAGDLSISMELDAEQSKFLDYFHPSLRSFLYFADAAAPSDLAAQGLESGTRWPHVRFPSFAYPIKWVGGMIGGKFTLHWGTSGTNDIEIDPIKVNEFAFTPKGEGMLEVTFRIQGHPNEAQRGRLWGLIQREITISIEPPTDEEEKALLEKTAAGK